MPLKVNPEEVEGYPEVLVLHVVGVLDTYTADSFRELFGKLLDRYRFFALNMEGVEYVSSMGWGVLVQSIYRARRKEGDLVLVNLRPQVARIFRIMGFSSLFKHFTDLDEAVRYLIREGGLKTRGGGR